MKQRFSFLVTILVFLPTLLVFLAWAGACRADSRELAGLVVETLANNPELKADEARWQSFVQQARQAGSLEDPMLMLRAQNLLIRDPLAFDRDSTSAKIIGLSQAVPFFGKRDLQRNAARLDAEENRWLLEERKVELARMVKENWYQLLFVDRSLEILEKSINILDDLVRLSETRYGVGQGLQQDVLRAQVERSGMEERRISLRQKRRSLEAGLNSLRLRPAATPIVPQSSLEITPLPTAAATPESLEQMALENHPLFRALEAREQGSTTRKQLAEKEFLPDFTFSLEYMQRNPSSMDRDGYDMYTAGVTFNLPIQRDRRHAMTAGAEAEARMVRAQQEAARNRAHLAIADILARLERGLRLSELYNRGVIPQAEHALAAARAAYAAGRADFADVLGSQAALFAYEQEYIEAVAEHQMQLAVLESVVGGSIQKEPSGQGEL